MLSSEQLKKITTEATPIIRQQLELAEKIAGFRDVVSAAGGDWGQLKAQIQDEDDEAGDGKRVRKILDRADYAQAYADMLGLGNLNEQNFSGDDTPEHDADGVVIEPENKRQDQPIGDEDRADPEKMYAAAVRVVLAEATASPSLLQRTLVIGYNKAAYLIERMEREGLVSTANDAGARTIIEHEIASTSTDPLQLRRDQGGEGTSSLTADQSQSESNEGQSLDHSTEAKGEDGVASRLIDGSGSVDVGGDMRDSAATGTIPAEGLAQTETAGSPQAGGGAVETPAAVLREGSEPAEAHILGSDRSTRSPATSVTPFRTVAPRRPHCLERGTGKPCAGIGKDHCHRCVRAHAQEIAVDAGGVPVEHQGVVNA